MCAHSAATAHATRAGEMPALCSVRGPSAGRSPRVRASPAMYSVPACAQLQMHLACAAQSGQAAHKRKPPLTATEPMQSLRTTASSCPPRASRQARQAGPARQLWSSAAETGGRSRSERGRGGRAHPAGSRSPRPPSARCPLRSRSAPRPPCSAPLPSCCLRPSVRSRILRPQTQRLCASSPTPVSAARNTSRPGRGSMLSRRSDLCQLPVQAVADRVRARSDAGCLLEQPACRPGGESCLAAWPRRSRQPRAQRRRQGAAALRSVAGPRLAKHEVVRPEDLPKWPRADRVHGAGLQVHQYRARHVSACPQACSVCHI